MADDLDSFFNEINQISADGELTEINHQINSTVISAKKNATVSNISNGIEHKNTIVQPASQIISKPAEINLVKTSHPVYTYPSIDVLDDHLEEQSGSYNQYSFSSSNEVSKLPVPVKQLSAHMPDPEKKFIRKAGDAVWVDDSLKDWPDNDYRIFVGDLAKDVTTEMLIKQFQNYPSYSRAKVIRTKHENKARGFGFVSFLDPMDCAKAIREMNGKYLGSRPMKLTKSKWKEREINEVQKKEKKKRKMDESLGLI